MEERERKPERERKNERERGQEEAEEKERGKREGRERGTGLFSKTRAMAERKDLRDPFWAWTMW